MIKKLIIKGCEGRGDFDKPYLTRWILYRCEKFALYFHKFHRSDHEEAVHDHPWNFITIVLWRGYYDCTYTGGVNLFGKPIFNRQRLYPGMIVYRPANHIHKVELVNNKVAYTLIIRFKYIRYWGFWHKGIFTVFNEYFKQHGC